MNRLKELRKEKKLTQEELASEIGVSKITILRWENGERQIKPDKAQALADYFGVPVGYLLGYEDKEYRNALAHGTVEPDKTYPFMSTTDETNLIAYYRLLGLENQKRLLDIANNMVQNQVYSSPTELLAIIERYKMTYGTSEVIEKLIDGIEIFIDTTSSHNHQRKDKTI